MSRIVPVVTVNFSDVAIADVAARAKSERPSTPGVIAIAVGVEVRDSRVHREAPRQEPGHVLGAFPSRPE